MSSYYSLTLPRVMYINFSDRYRPRSILDTSAVSRRHHRRRLLKYLPNLTSTSTPTPTIFKLSDDTLQITLKAPSNTLQQLETKLNQFFDYGRETYDDLRTIVAVDGHSGGLVISCKRSSVEFLIGLFVSSLVIVITLRGLFKLKKHVGGEVLVYKRDRSLGGKEVVVGKRETNLSTSRILTPLSSDNSANYYPKKNNRKTRRTKKELPQWWPQVVKWNPVETGNKEEYQRMANQFVQAIMDCKVNGEDVSPNDIVQLRDICKTHGVRTFISTENARDSLFRSSINYVLNYCESIMTNLSNSITINGEDVLEFIAGFADNIGLESACAARMVSAAVAARTRSRILQAWALEVQNKHSEAKVELFKVCLIHLIFPPAENSPEMEMVARSLEKTLDVEQRQYILNLFATVCGEDLHRSVVEALGLEGVKDEQGSQHAEIQ